MTTEPQLLADDPNVGTGDELVVMTRRERAQLFDHEQVSAIVRERLGKRERAHARRIVLEKKVAAMAAIIELLVLSKPAEQPMPPPESPVDPFSLNPSQLSALGAPSVRAHLEQLWKINRTEGNKQ